MSKTRSRRFLEAVGFLFLCLALAYLSSLLFKYLGEWVFVLFGVAVLLLFLPRKYSKLGNRK